jgi:muramidase (phage lysozyme)
MKTWLLATSALLLLAAIANRRREMLDLFASDAVTHDDVLRNVSDAGELGAWSSDPFYTVDTTTEQAQAPLFGVESMLAILDPSTYFPSMTDATTQAANRSAFLWMIRHAEGTTDANGYRKRFGGGYFSGFIDHPRIAVQFTDKAGRKRWTSAAGAYQFMAVSPIPGALGRFTEMDTWDRVSRKLQLTDFGPESQDRAALYLIEEAGALNDVDAGRFATAVDKVRRIWASLPGAGYEQPERTLASLESVYVRAGGQLA